MVIVDVRQVGDARALGRTIFGAALQMASQNVAHRFAAGGIAALLDELIERRSQILIERNGESIHGISAPGDGKLRRMRSTISPRPRRCKGPGAALSAMRVRVRMLQGVLVFMGVNVRFVAARVTMLQSAEFPQRHRQDGGAGAHHRHRDRRHAGGGGEYGRA